VAQRNVKHQVSRSIKCIGVIGGQSLPHHEMLKNVSSLLKVDAKVVHDRNVIVEFLSWR